MITLNAHLQRIINGQNLEGLKPFAFLYRNKWVEESGGGGAFELETTPIDISSMIVKPNTLSMTLDVSEIAQYSANNVTLTLADPFNRFIEGTPHSFFPSGFQLYGSRVILYYGTSTADMTSLFVGVIKELPTHKPESYQVDLKLISPLELLNDIEAKEFSNKYTGETLTANGYDDDNNPIYKTTNTGVGGFNAVYANGVKIFEGVDYEVSQTNTLGLPALVTITNSSYHSATITADYYCWKSGLTVEQIVAGLVALGGYSSNTDIRSVVWGNLVRTQEQTNIIASVGYGKSNFVYVARDNFNDSYFNTKVFNYFRYSYLPQRCKIELSALLWKHSSVSGYERVYSLGKFNASGLLTTGILIVFWGPYTGSADSGITVFQRINGVETRLGDVTNTHTGSANPATLNLTIERENNVVRIIGLNNTVTAAFDNDFDFGNSEEYNEKMRLSENASAIQFTSFTLTSLDDNSLQITNRGIIVESSINTEKTYTQIKGTLNETITYNLTYRIKENGSFTNWQETDLNASLGVETDTMQAILLVSSSGADITNFAFEYLNSSLVLSFVNLSGKTVLNAIQDLALISGYEFGVDRQGTFFFRPRSQSTTPIYELDHSEIVKVDTVKKNLNDFFTKLTLSFAQIPLEFYANEGERPTPVDRYGVINKEIDKPEIVNYDNPELAQAIGPQLLGIYSSLANIIQCTSKLNLGLELGDIVNLKRNYPLIVGNNSTDYDKFINQDTFYRACKITGINYNLGKKQLTYTLRDVSNKNNQPQADDADFKKPADWSDIRLGCPDNSIALYAAHKADFSEYDNIGFIANCTGGYNVFIDGVQYGTTYASGAQCNITWSTSGITTGDDITTPSALKAHKIWVSPATSGNNISLFHCSRVASSGTEQQGVLWVHFNLSNAINISSLLNNDTNTLSGSLCQSVTAKNNIIKFIGLYCSFSRVYNLEFVPVLEADTTDVKNLYRFLQYNSKLKDITLRNLFNKNDTTGGPSFSAFQETNIENIRGNWVCSPCSYMFANCKKLKNLPIIDASQTKEMENFLTYDVSLRDTILDVRDATGLKKIGCYGNSTYFMGGLKGLRVSDQAPFDNATAPQINVSYTGMSRSALRTLFTDLPTVSNGQIINVTGCTGNMLGEQGTVTFEDGIASGFSANDYYYFYKEFSETDKAWSIIIRAKVTNLSAVNTIISYGGNTKNSLQLGVNTSSKLVTYISSNGSSNDIANSKQSSLTINTNTYYYFKIEYTGANYIISVSEDDINYTPYITIDNATPIYNGAKLSLGFNQSRWPEALSGSIDFNETYFIVNGKTWFDINNMLTNADKAIATGKGWTVAA